MPSVATPDWYAEQAELTLARLESRIDALIKFPADRVAFMRRLRAYLPALFRLLHGLYGHQYDFFYHLEQILATAARAYDTRPRDLKAMDADRERDPNWFQSERMVGGVCYVDLFAGSLAGIRDKIPYFKELGLTYLHLMPLFRVPEGDSDGGYAVSSYREVDPKLGTMADLADLSRALRAEGISLVLDFVFNHTSDEHEWALRALAGDKKYQGYYFMFPDRAMPDQYERTLREIFPQQDPGSFTYRPEVDMWVWTTFRHFQWDLNYSNPEVFNAMLGEMLFLANQGVEIMRLDAVAFIWKQMGTPSESLPQVHHIIQAYNALLRIAAPGMLFKSEAIVHPAMVASYISREECEISYNPTLMALSWEALATREVRLLRESMRHWFAVPEGCAWVNYVRSHDDIGWTFADEDGWALGINGFDHRQFLNRFYTGAFEGSFAAGLPFNYNPVNHDMRISGTTASLAGLEQALAISEDADSQAISDSLRPVAQGFVQVRDEREDSQAISDSPLPPVGEGLGVRGLHIDYALRRIVLLYSVAMSAGGIPLIYLGDEIATLNDYTFRDDPAKADDTRWVHRPRFDWSAAERRHDPATTQGRVFGALHHLIQVRKATPALGRGGTTFFDTGSPHVLGYLREGGALCLANFSERPQAISRALLDATGFRTELAYDLLTRQVPPRGDLRLDAYAFLWLAAEA
jgi:amylosucrase